MLKNRKEAGSQMTRLLEAYRNKNVLILACSLGAVETASYIAQHLKADFSLLMSFKLPFPGRDQCYFGALGEGDSLYLDGEQHLMKHSQMIFSIIEESKKELQQRVKQFRNGTELPDIKGRTVILVDDMLVNGLEFIPAIRLCKAKGAERIVVAAVFGNIVFDRHVTDADELMIAHQHSGLTQSDLVYEMQEILPDVSIRQLLGARL